MLFLGSPLMAEDALLSFGQKIQQGDGMAGDGFGDALALSGATLAVGACHDDTTAGSDAGSVSVFVRNGGNWALQVKLTATDAAAGDRFGSSVALAGDTLVIGATHDDGSGSVFNSGSVYVFTRTGNVWAQQAKLGAADAAADDHFGGSVALSGETALIGADGKSSGTGAAYVFVRAGSTWSQQAKLTALAARPHDHFGGAVALDGDLAVIGAESHDSDGLSNNGRVFAFRRSGGTWTEEASWGASDPVTDGFFGASVALRGDKAIVGATGTNDYAGAAYVFRYDGVAWVAGEKLDVGDGLAYDAFGGSIALSEGRALIGAFRSTEEGIYDAGSSWLFADDGLSFQPLNRSSSVNPSSHGEFGRALAMEGDAVIVAEPGGSAATGGAYCFRAVMNPTEAQRWRHSYFWNVDNAGDAADDADPDHDGQVNILERAFSLDPIKGGGSVAIATGESGRLPMIQWVEEDGELRLEYLRRTNAVAHELVYTPQFSSTLANGDELGWLPPSGSEMVVPINAMWERVVVTDAPPVGVGGRFGRVKVTSP